MTIAIGMLCDEGLIISADTQIGMTDGSTHQGTKVHQAIADTGVYVVANATEDGNAANTLIPDILTDLQNQDPKDFANVERIVRSSMSEWADQYRQGNPYIQILLGVSLNRPRQTNVRAGGGVRLYNCEPPNTMVPVDRDDSSGGYMAIGAGASITDPIFRTLFGTACSLNIALHQVAYLMYRAKKDASSSCGGNTDAILIKNDFSLPLCVRRTDMELAEMHGNAFEHVLRMAGCAFYASDDFGAKIIWDATTDYVVRSGASIRSQRFFTEHEEEVG
ncbi:MAG: hypothetical protein ACLQMO_07510 [Acidobacteriaceae bacterium]